MNCYSSGAPSRRLFVELSVLLFLAVVATGAGLHPPGSWDDYDDDLFAAAAALRRSWSRGLPPPGSWDDYDDDIFAKKRSGFQDSPRYRPSWLPCRSGIPSFMKPIRAPFMGRKSKQTEGMNGKSNAPQFPPRPLRPILHYTNNGRNVMF